MRLHNEEIENLLDNFLPSSYTGKMLDKLGWEDNKKNRNRLRSVRYGRAEDDLVMLSFIELANEHKIARLKAKEILES